MPSLNFLTIFCLVIIVRYNAQDCILTKDPGHPCEEGSAERRFYYDTRMGVCQPFNYLGCGGNGNNFESSKLCKSSCGKDKVAKSGSSGITTKPKSTGHAQWVHAEKCGATHLIPDGKIEECRVGKSSCPEGHKCKNGFCCPTKDYVCSLRDDTGTFADGIEDKPRFAWSDEIQSCWRFSYYGARGNYNNFASFRDCINFCGGN
ncbi:unnamed protein product [Bursaphelenchus xylophilus]|uniref:(pine wood nematode) hypothetical protein n=1 Tax=Bursaphelenchus xylophilus TaxID=6326 RepID=A0A1I7RNR7_BURXY|nr:unnamed protein product [Bursaphelenchus xylophilus]CAG9124244.1 unnamed protein product [Bursaphelenchus xylophilus]